MYKKYSKLKTVSMCLYLAFLIIITLKPINVRGNWSDDFSDGNLSEWELSATNWRQSDTTGEITVVEHGLYVEDGILKSDGRTYSEQQIFQTACRSNEFVVETWSGDAFNAENWGWGFQIGRNLDYSENFTLNSETDESYYYLIFSQTDLYWIYSGDSRVLGDEKFEEAVDYMLPIGQTTEGWHSYVINFGEEEFDIYMDGDLIVKHAVSHLDKSRTFDSFNMICLVTGYASADMWDNIELIESSETSSPPAEKSNDDNLPFTIVVFGTGFIVVTTSAYTLNKFYKKKQ